MCIGFHVKSFDGTDASIKSVASINKLQLAIDKVGFKKP
jgi:hypothetical protein